ncbi:hypothetical protein CALVIDRAFT_555096 [Calocera viscosa TUFC12733]|uniref:Uncharacterized protein n=1 Tax=Calocera viscosa (strain TUFC12733) TaxID=1330018 RepID=A0A167M4P6_CALVF|nr:hypothetical protein CALVIDRAFT_555096 [Calocera viscosa TUFC12733]
MALTMTALRTPPSPSHLPYTSTLRKSYRSVPPAPLAQPLAQKNLDLDLSDIGSALTTAHTPPLSSASTSSSSSVGAPKTGSAKDVSRTILFGTGLPSSPLTRRSMAGVEHKRTLSFSATLFRHPSVASISSFEGEGREEQFHASFPLPPTMDTGDEAFSYAHMRRASLPTSDRGSWTDHLNDFSKLLDEVMPCTPSFAPLNPKDYPSTPEYFRSRPSVYPESCHSVATTLSSRPSRDDLHAKPYSRDTMMSLPFVWADGSPIRRQPTNASTHRATRGMRREKSVYAPFPESPKALSPTASESEMSFLFSDVDPFSSHTYGSPRTAGSPRRRGRLAKRPSAKNLILAAQSEPMPLNARMEIETILEADPQADEQPSPVPSSVFLPDSQWPTPLLAPMQLPIEDMPPLQLDGTFEASQDNIPSVQDVEQMDLEEVLRNMEVIMRVTEELDLKYPRSSTLDKKSTSSDDVEHSRGNMESTQSRNTTKPLRLPTKPLKIHKELPSPPQTTVEITDSRDINHGRSSPRGLNAKRSANDLWRTMVPNSISPVQPNQEKIKQTNHLRSAHSSPKSLPADVRTPSPFKRSPPQSIRSPSPTQVSPPSLRCPSPAKVAPPPRPTRSPSPLLLEDLEFLEEINSALRSAAASPIPSQFGMRSSPTMLNTRTRRDSIETFISTIDESLDGFDQTSLLRVPQHQIAQQIPSKAARKLGISEDAVMVHTRSPSRNSNFSDHNLPVSPKPKKNPFGSLFGSPNKKGAKGKLEISLPLLTSVDPVVLYTPSAKSATPSYSIHPEPDFHHSVSPFLMTPTLGRPTSPGTPSMTRSPMNAAHIRSRRDRSTEQWI